METSNKYRILLVDNNQAYLKVLQFQLGEVIGDRIEYIDEAYNGLHAIEMAREKPYDIVFMDIEMPVLDGIDTTIFFKHNHPLTMIIGLSLYDNEEFLSGIIEAGAKEYVIKEMMDEASLERIFNNLDKEIPALRANEI
jgi:two-component system, NarL family, nitrate/nitrite response regulator NarL